MSGISVNGKNGGSSSFGTYMSASGGYSGGQPSGGLGAVGVGEQLIHRLGQVLQVPLLLPHRGLVMVVLVVAPEEQVHSEIQLTEKRYQQLGLEVAVQDYVLIHQRVSRVPEQMAQFIFTGEVHMWARIEENKVEEITEINPEGRFHPSLIWKNALLTHSRGFIY
ncbi:hypothetical protein K3392_05105 [Escherichia coli]|nr:hypothetical protein K3392_05105 [Escherichia coli]